VCWARRRCGGGADHAQGGDEFGSEDLDPIWTTAYVQRGFGYMVWDTLFSVDDTFA